MWKEKKDFKYRQEAGFFSAMENGQCVHCNPNEVVILKNGVLSKVSSADFDLLTGSESEVDGGAAKEQKTNRQAKEVCEAKG